VSSVLLQLNPAFARRVTEHFVSVVHWWTQELREIWISMVRKIAPSRATRITIALAQNGGHVDTMSPDGKSTTVAFSNDVSGSLPSDRESFWPNPGKQRTRATVLLPDSSVLIRELVLPKGVQNNLARVIDLQLERELPLPRDQLCVDWQVASRDAGASRINVLVAVARRSYLESIRSTLQGWQLELLGINSVHATTGVRFEFLKRRLTRSVAGFSSVDRRLSLIAVGLLAAFALIVGGQWWYERHSVNPIVAAEHATAKTILELRTNLNRQAEPLAALRIIMQGPTTAEIVTGLTSALPQDAWLQRLQLQNRIGKPIELKFTAITPDANALVDHLHSESQLAQTKLISSTSTGTANPKERAEIVTQWNVPKSEPAKPTSDLSP
jgi:hypothetical protein